MSRWPTVPLESLYAEPSRNGLTKPRRVRGAGYKMVNMGELFRYDRIHNQPMERVPLTDRELSVTTLVPGDLLFARQSLKLEGTGKCSIVLEVAEITTFESHLIRVRLDRVRTNPLFYYYYFSSPQGRASVLSIATQVAAAGIRGSELATLLVPFPPVEEQHLIAEVIAAYDELIENNVRRMALLEEMAQTLYREWFVNFRFPGHEQVEMVESELGSVPGGWELRPMSEVVEVNPSLEFDRTAERPYVPMANVNEHSMLVEPKELRTGRSGSKFQNGDTLIARITPSLENGKTGFVQFLSGPDAVALGSTEFIVLRSLTLCPEFVYFLARSEAVRAPAIKTMTGASGRQRVQIQVFGEITVPQPPHELIEQFRNVVRPMFDMVWGLARKNEILRRTRDLLLPKLMSGEIDLRCSDEVPEAAVA